MKARLSTVARTIALGVALTFALPFAGGALPFTPLDTRAEAADSRAERRIERKVERRMDRRDRNVVVKRRPVHRTVVVAPRKRVHRNVVVVRPHGHSYWGYGHHHHDNDAWKWLAFTAITLKVLDSIDEASQRAHEAAQIEATTAAVGEKIIWETDTSSGYVVATKEGQTTSGQTCREFQQTVTIGGESETAYGTACLQADGSWKMQS